MISVIISHYNNVANLALILGALSKQSVSDFEVIVSEDGQDPKTAAFLASHRYPFPLQHTTQEDIGFRKNRILNTSVQAAKGSFLVFIDGDCIPHKHFVKAYQKVQNTNMICYGRRVMLSEKITAMLQKKMQFDGLSMLDLILGGAKKCKEGIYTAIPLSTKERGLKGCNWGIKKGLLIQINGFDEAYVNATVGEDDDVEWRLKGIGIKKKYSMRNKAIVYHLYHKRTYNRNDWDINFNIMKTNQKTKQYICKNGLNKKNI